MGFELKAIIFDFNGVIVDDEPLHLELFKRVMSEEGMTLTDVEYHEKYLGYDDRGCFSAALADFGRSQAAGDTVYVDELIARKADYYHAAIEQRFLLFPGAVELIRLAASRYPLAIASGALRSEIEMVLSRGEIRDAFHVIIAAEDVSACKPDPEGYLKALEKLNGLSPGAEIRPHECLVIEDSVAGVEAAKRAEMRCLAVTNSYHAEDLRQADWIRDSLIDFDPNQLPLV